MPEREIILAKERREAFVSSQSGERNKNHLEEAAYLAEGKRGKSVEKGALPSQEIGNAGRVKNLIGKKGFEQ